MKFKDTWAFLNDDLRFDIGFPVYNSNLPFLGVTTCIEESAVFTNEDGTVSSGDIGVLYATEDGMFYAVGLEEGVYRLSVINPIESRKRLFKSLAVNLGLGKDVKREEYIFDKLYSYDEDDNIVFFNANIMFTI